MVYRSLQAKQTGSTHLIVLVVAVLVIIGGIGAYLATGGFKKTVTATTPTEVKALLASARAGDYDAKCTYENKEADSDALIVATGPSTLYVSGADKMRMDTEVSGKNTHMMQLDDSMYMWADDNDKGSKFPITDSSDSANEFAEDAEKNQLKCESADLDASMFELPSNVTFTEPRTQFESSSNSGNR